MLKWVLLFVVVYVIYRGLTRSPASTPQRPSQSGEQMVECAQCHVRFPQSEAIGVEGQIFCSEQHRASWIRTR